MPAGSQPLPFNPDTAMIIRTIHNRDNPYFMLRRATAQDSNLTARALGVLVYLMSKPDTWEPTIPDICSRFSDIGRDQAYKIINEIFIPLRYARRVQERGGSGQIAKWVTEVFEEPLPEPQEQASPENQDAPLPEKKNVAKTPVPDLPVPDLPVPENQEHIKYRVQENTEQKENTEQQQEKPAAAASRFGFAAILKFVAATRKTAANPIGLAKHLEQSGEDDDLIQSWLAQQPKQFSDLNRMPFDAFAQQEAELEEREREVAWLATLPDETYQAFFDEGAAELKRRFPSHCRGADWQSRHKGGIERMMINNHYRQEAV